MRQISLFNPAVTRQMHILTTRTDLTPGEVRYRMGSRWRQVNHYRYARMHFDLDSRDWGYRPLAGDYRAADDDPDRMVPNPAKKPAYQQVEKARRALHSAETASDIALLAAHSPPPGTSVVPTNAMINTITADVRTAEQALEAALTAHRAIPTRLPLSQVHPGQQVLDTETKLIHHAIRIAAFNTAQSLARAIVTATGYTRAHDEAHTLIRTALAGSGDIIPDGDTLYIRLDPLSAPRHTAAIDELCQALNDTNTAYPGTEVTSRCATASNPTDDPATITSLCPESWVSAHGTITANSSQHPALEPGADPRHHGPSFIAAPASVQARLDAYRLALDPQGPHASRSCALWGRSAVGDGACRIGQSGGAVIFPFNWDVRKAAEE
jgi:hypothetical protein